MSDRRPNPPRRPTRSPVAGGAPLALAIFAGTGIGIAAGQPVIGFLVGLVAGGAIGVAIWLVDRRR